VYDMTNALELLSRTSSIKAVPLRGTAGAPAPGTAFAEEILHRYRGCE
jgi:hypothetical protein